MIKPIDIKSRENPKYRLWKTLIGSRGIKRHGLTLVSGSKIVPEILQFYPELVEGCVVCAREEPPPAGISPEQPLYRLGRAMFRELDIHGTGYPLLLVKTPGIPDFEPESLQSDVLLLVPFQDPGNVGAVIRSAAAFGLVDVVLLSEAALPFHPKSIRSGGTAVFQVSLYKGPSIYELELLKIPVVALSPDGVTISKFVFPERFAFLPGLEGPGMPSNLKADHTVSIPMEPHVESLNAAVAASVAFYEYKRRQIR